MRTLIVITLALSLSGCCMVARRKSAACAPCAATYPPSLRATLADSCGNCPPAPPQKWDCRDSYTCPDFTTTRLTR